MINSQDDSGSGCSEDVCRRFSDGIFSNMRVFIKNNKDKDKDYKLKIFLSMMIMIHSLDDSGSGCSEDVCRRFSESIFSKIRVFMMICQ